MKYSIFTVSLIILPLGLFSQNVGIGTTNPQETLHIAGDLIISETQQAAVITTKMLGLDANGTVREVTVGAHLTLSGNRLDAAGSSRDYEFGTLTLPLASNNNVDLLLDEGESNFGKQIIKISRSTAGDIEITGITGGYDGQHIWLYAQNGKITLAPLDVSSVAINQIENNSKKTAEQWAMIELVYDGLNSKWIIMQNHR